MIVKLEGVEVNYHPGSTLKKHGDDFEWESVGEYGIAINIKITDEGGIQNPHGVSERIIDIVSKVMKGIDFDET